MRLPELALGIGLAAAGALASVLWASRAPSQRVVVAARALQRGEALDVSMIRWVTVSGDRIAAVTDPSLLRGGVLQLDVAAGAPLQTAMLVAPDALASDELEVALALEPGDYPPALTTGDRASVVIIPSTDPMGTTPNPRVLDAPVRVRSVSTAESAVGSRAIITLAVPKEDAALVLAAARVRLALLPTDGGR